MKIRTIFPLAAALFIGTAAADSQDRAEPLVAALGLGEERRARLMEDLKSALESDTEPAWLAGLATPEGLETLRKYHRDHGFLPADLEWIDKLPDDAPADLRAKATALHARQLMRHGPPEIAAQWPKWDSGETPGADKTQSLPDGTLAELLEAFVPKNPVYRVLLDRYRTMGGQLEKLRADFTPIPPIKEGEIVKPGDTYQGVPVLARRLVEEGYLSERPETPEENTNIYTEEMSEAVKRFQKHYGRAVDGILGPDTLAELNRTPDMEHEILRINLHRARMLPDDPGERHVIVNIPSNRVFAFAKPGDTPDLQMKTIVGQAIRDRQTPVFRDVMETVEFGPYWNVPVSIASGEIVPQARGDHGHMARNNFEIVRSFGASDTLPVTSSNLSRVASGDLLVRQRPGSSNALGWVKFLFPNDFAIYLHDTPQDHLFEEAERDFSHGCIRVERPADLAEFVLGPQGWSRAEVESALKNAENRRVEVKQPVMVYIIYLTAFPDWDESDPRTVRFHPDIYNRDTAISDELKQAKADPGS